MQFASDNWAGASAPIMEALARHSDGYAPAYGGDTLTASIEQKFSDIFETDCSVWFAATGTGANALAISALTGPGSGVLCHKDAHIRVDECGAAEFMQPGCRLFGLEGTFGKITPATLSDQLDQFPEGVARFGSPAVLSITQATEVGTAYSIDEIKALTQLAKSRKMACHMDGARFANALVSLGVTPADMTWRAGIDVLSFGATKNGAWCAEAIVLFKQDLIDQMVERRLRAGHLFSKMRFVAAQFEGYLENDHWLGNAKHANAMAVRLTDGLKSIETTRPAWASQSNEVFAILPKGPAAKAREAGATFHEWPATELPVDEQPTEDEILVRLVCSFQTKPEDVDQFLSYFQG